MIKVLIVEDSRAVQEFLIHIFSSDPEMEIVGIAGDGQEALVMVQQKRPDVVTMDINMPKMDGFEATRKMMETQPTPIVIVSGSAHVREIATTFRAMEAGALAVVPRPLGLGHPDYAASTRELIQTVKLMSEVKVVRRWPQAKMGRATPALEVRAAPALIRVVAMGASTGGPIVLQTILSSLPKDFPVPVLIVQHIAAGFVQGFADWLAQSTRFPVQVAAAGDSLLPGHVYIAPDGCHTGIGNGRGITLSRAEPENGLRPSISYLFRSVAQVFGSHAVGVLLTGMGKDGAEELKLLKEKGAVTIAQDKESSVVHGMPGEAIRLDAAMHVLPPEKIAAVLAELIMKR